MRYVIIAEVASETKRERWRGFSDEKETFRQLAKRACGNEFTLFILIAVFTEDEYTKEKGNEAWAEFKRMSRLADVAFQTGRFPTPP